ncbi:wings apart-like protein homolog [Brienomyrus brachyistius]|uniref:wings apart-like protein homolog n=1 Tax=Brienomyrus brachyistius TaxID=42636 RepID=UPI0020B449E7|nr:wings apart-like protein homolog [Brienomyrus brachyistius]
MTSRFGKTYSRKGGDGNSKFDEVLSNKRATLSTKWGETTFKAQLGSKRPNFKPDVTDAPKKARPSEGEDTEDPFGFDSDDESKPVTSRSCPSAKPPQSKLVPVEAVRAERPVLQQEYNSHANVSESLDPGVLSSTQYDNNNAYSVSLDFSSKVFNNAPTDKTVHTWSIEGAEKQTSTWYENASEKDKKPVLQTPSLKMDTKNSLESWNSAGGDLRPALPGIETFKGSDSMWLTSYWQEDDKGPTEEESPSHVEENTHSNESSQEEAGLPAGNSESEDLTQSPLRPNNCRTYRRPNKCQQAAGTGNGSGNLPHGRGGQELPKAGCGTGTADGKSGARGRTRDYTVLHPSCLSVCNVTIQDALDRSMEELTAAPADLGEAGRLRKKTEMASVKPTRFRPSQTKSKKETKLEFFGFEENEGQAVEGDPMSSGSTNYKIKYFGFDDLSESDSDEDDEAAEKRKAKKARAAAAARASSVAASATLSAAVHSPQPGDSQACRTGSNTDNVEFLDSCPAVLEAPKKPQGKQLEKSKDCRRIFSGPKKSPAKAVYNARHWNQPEPEDTPAPSLSRSQTAPAILSQGSTESNTRKDDGVFKAPAPPPKVIKSVTIPTEPYQDIVTALKCRKEHKELYTVVQHVKHFNDVVEFGENQEFTDDFEYLETGLKSGQPLNTRCLSIISLATRCAMPSFRMHLRARGKVAQVFKTLNDAPQHPNLALCTASLMYILSRDRLNMDLDRASLDLMIRLLELEQDDTADNQLTAKEMGKVKEKIRKLCETVHNKHLDLENITTGHLAMETLLSLTSKRAGDWFKEELRLLGGLDHIVDKVKECVENLSQEDDKENLVASLWGAERCLRVLESVTVHNPENQNYLIAYKESQLIVSSARGLRHCEAMIQRYSCQVDSAPHQPLWRVSSVGKAVEDCMRAIIGVLLNLTHDNEWGSTKTGEQESLIITALNCVLRVPQYLPQEQRFDIRVLGLGLLINLVEYSARNRHCLVEMEVDSVPFDSICVGEGEDLKTEGSFSAISALVQLFLQRERAAVLAETETDDFISDAPKPQQDQSGEWQETSGEIQWVASENNDKADNNEKKEEEEEELDLNKALQHAGKHMEDSIVASYTALLLGCLCQESPMNVTAVRDILPKGDFSIMTEMLKKFLNFMNLTCAVGTTGQKSISRVIDYLEHC